MSEELLQGLCERAKAQGTTVSSLVAEILEASTPEGLKPKAAIPAEIQEILDRLRNLEGWVALLLGILAMGDEDPWTIGEKVPCPQCGSTELAYYDVAAGSVPSAKGAAQVLTYGFVCRSCKWEVAFTDAGAGQPCEQPSAG